MKTLLLATVAIVLAVPAAQAIEDQAHLGIFAETSVNKIAGMPAMPAMPPGMDMSKMPAGMADMFGGKPARKLDVRLWSPGIAPDDAFATLIPPAGLKQKKEMKLDIYRPKPEKGEADTGEARGATTSGKQMEFTIKVYWGSSRTVKPGQPKVITSGTMKPEERAQMNKQASKSAKDSPWFYKPDWTTGHWPTDKQPCMIVADAKLPGLYDLKTNYTGNVSIEAPANVDFLDGFEFTSPDFTEKIPLDKPIVYEWNQIQNAIGLHANMIGMEGKNTLILWSSSETYAEGSLGIDWGYLQMAEVRKFVEDRVMMAGTQTTVIVPGGIFAKCGFVSAGMVGYGPGAALGKGQPLPRIQTKTTARITLGGKDGFGAGMGGKAPAEDTGGEE